MICGISMGAQLKKIYRNNCTQTSPAKAINNLPISPKESGMDALVLQPKDLSVFTAKQLVSAVNDRHPDVKVIYIYSKESDGGKLSEVDKYLIKKMTPEALKEAIDESLSEKVLTEKNIAIASNDKKVLSGKRLAKERRARTIKELKENVSEEESEITIIDKGEEDTEEKEIETKEVEVNEEENSEPIQIEDDNNFNMHKDRVVPKIDYSKPEPTPNIFEEPKRSLSIEENLNNIVELTDWGILKESCNIEKIKVELMNESSQYADCMNYMSILEQRVRTVFKDENISAEEKMLKIREIGIEKSGIKAQSNNILAQKYTKIIDSITDLVCKDMDRRIIEIKDSLNKLVVKQDFFTRTGDVRDLIDKRLEMRVKLAELMSGIIQTYKVMHGTSQDIIANMDENLPTESNYINEIMKPYESYFKPENAGNLFLEITRAVEEKRLMLSVVEDKLESIFTAIFKLIELDEEIINNYQTKIDIFKAQNTEEVIVMTTALKSALRLYIGPKNVGLTTTALTVSGCQARRRNTILLDLRNNSKLDNYKVNLFDLDEFLDTKVEHPMVVCKESITDVDRLEEVLKKLNDKLYYYYNINIILDDEQTELVERLGSELKTIIYVTNCTPLALEETKELVGKIKLENVARKIVEIAPPIDPIEIALSVGIDVTKCQVTTVPYMLDVAKCTAEGQVPYFKPEIRSVYEKGMKI